MFGTFCRFVYMTMNLNKLKHFLFLPLFIISFVACEDDVTYSDMKEKEVDAVNRFVKENGIKIISYEQFVANDSTTDVSKNEFVEIDDVYLQIVNNPKDAADARRIEDGDIRNLLVRYYEYNIQDGDTISGNLFAAEADEMRVENNSGTYSATFTNGVMASVYGNNVPTGWLVPFSYLWFTRHQSQLAKVNLIVPHTKGTSNASSYVYPCFYQITFKPDRNFYDVD